MALDEGHLDVERRREEKRLSREEDARRLAAGEVTPAGLAARNGFFSMLDRSRARIVARRVRLRPR